MARTTKKKTAAAGKGGIRRKKAAPAATTSRKRQGKKKTTTRRKKVTRRHIPGKQLRQLRDLLLEKRRELTHSYTVAKGDSRSAPDDGTEDYIDYAVSSYAREFLLSLTELERQQLRMVEEALQRMDRGEYGRCLQCGVEIPLKRLEAVPWVRFCIRCQELSEQGLLPQLPLSSESSVELEPEVMDEEELPGEEEDEEEEEPDDEVAEGAEAEDED